MIRTSGHKQRSTPGLPRGDGLQTALIREVIA
jgi:hypothetical protein